MALPPHGSVGMRGNVSPSQLPLHLCIVLTCDLWSVRPYVDLIRQTGVYISHRNIKRAIKMPTVKVAH